MEATALMKHRHMSKELRSHTLEDRSFSFFLSFRYHFLLYFDMAHLSRCEQLWLYSVKW